MNKLIPVAFAILILTGCSAKPATPVVLTQPALTAIAPSTPQPTLTLNPTLTPTSAETLTPTNTPPPTTTPSPTITPTTALPVGLGSNLPQPSSPISASNVTSLTELARYGSARIYDTYLSVDRSRIFSLTGNGIKVYQTENMERIAWFIGLEPLQSDWGGINWNITASADGNRFTLLTEGNQVQVFDLQDGLIYTHTLPTAWNTWAAISMDGSRLAVPIPTDENWNSHWQIFDLSSGTIVAKGIGTYVKFSPLGTYLSAQSGNNLYIYRTADWQEQAQIGLSGSGENASNWIFSPDDRYIAIVLPSKITIWEVENRLPVREVQPLGSSEAEIYGAFFSESSEQLAVRQGYQRQSDLLIWNITDGSLVSQQPARESGVYTFDEVLLEADGLLGYNVPIEGDGSGYQAPQGKTYQQALDLNSDNLSLVDNAWDPITYESFYKICKFAFSPSDSPPCQEVSGALGITSDGMGNFYSLWQEDKSNTVSLHPGLVHGETELITFSTGGYPISLNAVSPNHNLVAYSLGSGLSTIQLRDLGTNRVVYSEDTTGGIERVQFTPDSLRMAVTIANPGNSHPQILVFDVTTNAVIFRLPAQALHRGESAVLSDNGEWLAFYLQISTSYKWSGIKIFDPLHQRELASFEGDIKSIGNPMIFSPDSSLLATIDNQGSVLLIDASTGQVLHSWVAHSDGVTNLAFSPDGRLLATTGMDGFVRIWGIWP